MYRKTHDQNVLFYALLVPKALVLAVLISAQDKGEYVGIVNLYKTLNAYSTGKWVKVMFQIMYNSLSNTMSRI